ncbi:14984_t:CDS:10, partial [Entrophospora sp. SA101]
NNFVKQEGSVCDRGILSEASSGKSSSSGWPANFIAQKLLDVIKQHKASATEGYCRKPLMMGKKNSSRANVTMQERQVNWMLSCPNPTPLAFFQYIVPTHRVRATEKYYQALDLALSETDNHGLQNLVRRSIHSTNLNIHEEINTFAQNKDMPSAKRVRIDGVKTLIGFIVSGNLISRLATNKSKLITLCNTIRTRRMDNKDGELEVYAKETIRNDGKKWIIYDTDVHNSLTKWKQERVQPRTDLAFYDIIDISPGSNSGFVQSLPRDVVHEIRRSKSLSTPNMDNIDGMKDYIIDFIKKKNFRNYVDESYMKTRINNTTKFIWDYLNFLVESFERDNDLADYNLSELGYNVCSLSGEKCLFASSEDRNQEKNDKEDRNAGRKVDIIWSMKPTDLEFFVGEVSGPPNQRNHTHFFNDKIKIAKMLKVIFNRVVKKYGGAGMSLSLLKLYGLHVYYNEVIIYEMSIPFRGLYVFCEVLQSKLPTNKVEVGLILRSASVLLKFKGLLEKSLTDLKDYIQDACTRTPDNNEDADQYITHTDLTPVKNRTQQ